MRGALDNLVKGGAGQVRRSQRKSEPRNSRDWLGNSLGKADLGCTIHSGSNETRGFTSRVPVFGRGELMGSGRMRRGDGARASEKPRGESAKSTSLKQGKRTARASSRETESETETARLSRLDGKFCFELTWSVRKSHGNHF